MSLSNLVKNAVGSTPLGATALDVYSSGKSLLSKLAQQSAKNTSPQWGSSDGFSVTNRGGNTMTTNSANPTTFSVPSSLSSTSLNQKTPEVGGKTIPMNNTPIRSDITSNQVMLNKPKPTPTPSQGTGFAGAQQPISTGGFTSSDPDVIKKLAAMNAQVNSQTSTNPLGSTGTTQGSSTPSPVTGASSGMSTQDQLMQAYLKSLTSAGEQTDAQRQLAALQEQARSVDLAKQMGMDKVTANAEIPMDVITGRNANIQRTAATQLQAITNQEQPYLTQIAQEEAKRNAEQNTLKAMLDYSQKTADPMTVSAGSTVIDPTTGQVIYQSPASDKAYTPTASIQEYEYAKQNGYTGSFTDYQTEDANRKASASGSGMLTPAQQQSTINSIAGAWDNEPIVKSYNIVAEGYQFAKNVANKANPTSADDQGLIYAFAKAMDPNSVVRESEYDTVQKYNQSMIERGWADAKRLAKNVAFLTPEARKNMIATIQQKYAAAEQNYKNVYNKYNQEIEAVKSGQVGRGITDYSAAWDGGASSNTGSSEFSW